MWDFYPLSGVQSRNWVTSYLERKPSQIKKPSVANASISLFIYIIHSGALGCLYKKFNPMQQLQLFVSTINSQSGNKN
ncbi:hypothetical protein UF37_16055 [Vibrio parahaemolyticus]|uniref:hypothetical protein n=1 Tax=Vibrio parahaemolyticus TaxID=670 RepID=UPI00062B18DF|nr:hypothetical protein [Vibrio parahaemolyticus]KKX79963.1 hypothetical protein UF37_16055 [Vibrio parahaemolyticus]